MILRMQRLKFHAKKWQRIQAKGFNIELYHRTDRSGYKAGALKEAMPYAKGQFIAIFDADFLPNPDFPFNNHSSFCPP